MRSERDSVFHSIVVRKTMCIIMDGGAAAHSTGCSPSSRGLWCLVIQNGVEFNGQFNTTTSRATVHLAQDLLWDNAATGKRSAETLSAIAKKASAVDWTTEAGSSIQSTVVPMFGIHGTAKAAKQFCRDESPPHFPLQNVICKNASTRHL